MIASENEKINMLIVRLEALGIWGHFLPHHFTPDHKEFIVHLAEGKRHVVFSKYQDLSFRIRICG